MRKITKQLYFAIACLSLALGFIGIFLPLLPTTPFVLLASFCFSRSSERMHLWLLEQKTFGPMIRDWDEHGVIRPRAKWLASVLILVTLSYPILLGPIPNWIKLLLIVVLFCVLAFIWSRPSHKP